MIKAAMLNMKAVPPAREKRMKALLFVCCTLLALPVLAESPANSRLDAMAGSVPVVTDAWISEAPPVAKNNAAYITVQNGNVRDALVGVESPASAKAELHQMSMAGGLMRMQRLPRINLAAQQRLVFGPGGRHIMLIDMKQPLKAGDKVPLTLVFRKAGRVTVEAEVRPVVVDGQSAAAPQ
jgi:periplasmic copper chaperone A